MTNKAMDAVLERAIQNEEEAYRFYVQLHELVEDTEAKDTLLFLAEEEKGHKAYLMRYREGGFYELMADASRITDYRVVEHTERPEIRKGMTTRDVYLVAAAKELAAHNLYQELAAIHPGGAVKDMLLRMAREELKHKEKVEYLYTNTAFPQTAGG
ncbi:MAG: hypothetical protein CVU61_07035 [Deltaproteobacteria bacterium HGW-Deltaproteobacteria-19]|nr:MAG: hypothetical protein CVU61_07035 [Deltaproteobacteria bacterium HGW-Deltaproteobacteria-19]